MSMIRFSKALRAWGTAEFEAEIKYEILQLAHDQLPLHQALSMGSDVVNTPITPIVQVVSDLGVLLRIRVGIMFQSVIAGCSCAEDPATTSENSEYCELQFDVDKISGIATVALL